AGVRAILAFGGHALRHALERRILADRDPERRTALLAAWRGSCSREFADGLLRVAADSRTPAALGCAAACVVADQGDPRALPLLRRSLERAADVATAARLMQATERLGAVVDLAPDDELVASTHAVRLAA